MRNKTMKKAAVLMAAMMAVPGYAAYAQENTQIEVQAEKEAGADAESREAEEAAKAEAESRAAEEAAKAEAESRAAEEAAKAEAGSRAAEEAAKAEAESHAAEEAAKTETESRTAEEATGAEAEKQTEEATTEPPTEAVTEAPTEMTTEAVTEKATEKATDAQEKETEKEYQTSFHFENDEVVMDVMVSKDAKLEKDVKMAVRKLEAGSEGYEAAKAATMNSLGSDEDGTYSFYEIAFEKNGTEVNVDDSFIQTNVSFKNDASAVRVKDGAAKRI